jgi:hypothetical protein
MIDLGIGLEVDVVSMRFFQSDGVYNSDEKVVSIEQQNQFEITLEEKILQYQYEEYKDDTAFKYNYKSSKTKTHLLGDV